MRACSWYRVVVVCLLSGSVLGVLNFLLCAVPPAEPCSCDCFEVVSRREAELKVFYEHEIDTREKKIREIEALQTAVEISAVPSKSRGNGRATEQTRHRLAVLVPFRNRHEELYEFVPHIHQFLNRQNVHHEIWVINQADSHRFNRASLLNTGFLLSRNNCDYMVMHDVDLLPQNDDLKYMYPSAGPYHISSPALHPLYHYKTFVGGILSLTREQFETVNGLSNLFWGWGREDDELYLRMKEAGMKEAFCGRLRIVGEQESVHAKLEAHNITVQYPVGITTGHKTFRHIHDKVKRPRDQKSYYNQWEMSRKRDRTTGLNTLKYSLLSHLNMTINGSPFHFVNVELACDTTVTPFCDVPPK